MDTTVIVADLAARLRSAGGPDGLWVSAADALRIGGWELGPEGACQGSRCVPLPPGVLRDGLLDLAGFARSLGQPVVHDSTNDVWVIGESADDLREGLRSLEAPDFTLPDLEGRRHRLSDHRGTKVFLVTWASW